MTLALPIRWVQPGADPGEASEPAGPGEWRAVPAIERAAGDIELTAPARAFVGGLASQQSTAASPGSLRPGRSLDAPAGLVRGIARVLDGGRRGGPELVQAPRERARHGTGGSWSVDDADMPEAIAADVGVEEDVPVAAEPAAPPALDLPRARPVAAVARVDAPSAPKALLRAPETAPLPPAIGRVLPSSTSPSAAVHAEAEPDVFEETAAPDLLPPAEPSHDAPPLPPEFRPRRVRGTFTAPPPLAAPAPPLPQPGPQSQDAAVSDTASPSLAAPAAETPQPGSQHQVAESPRTEPLPVVARMPDLPQPGSQNESGELSAPVVARTSETPQPGSQNQIADVMRPASPPLVARASEKPQPASRNQIAESPRTQSPPVVARTRQPGPQNEVAEFSPPAAPTSESPQPGSQTQFAAAQRSAPAPHRNPLSDESSLSAVRPGARPRATPQPGSQNQVAETSRPAPPPLVARASESPQSDSEVTHPAPPPLVARASESPQPDSKNQIAEVTRPASPPLVARAPESPQPGSQNVRAAGAAVPGRDRNPLSDESSLSSLRPGTPPRVTPQPDSKNQIAEVRHTASPLVARASESPQARSQSQVTVGSAAAPGRDRKPLSDESSLSAVRPGTRPGAIPQPGSKNQIAESPHTAAPTIVARASTAATAEPRPSTAAVERTESLPVVQARLLDVPVSVREHQAPEASHDAVPSPTETTAVVSAQPTALAASTPDTTAHVETARPSSAVSARPSPPAVQRRATSGELAPVMPARAAESHRGESPASEVPTARVLEDSPRSSTAARREDERATNAAPAVHELVVERASEPVQHRSVQPADEVGAIVRARTADAPPDVVPTQQQQRAVGTAPVETRVARAVDQSTPSPVVPTREVAAPPRESLAPAAEVQRREDVSVQRTAPATAEPTRVGTPAPAEITEQQPRVAAERSVALPHPVVSARVAEVQRVARSTPVAERRPGLDFHSALSAPPVSPPTPAVISRAVVTAATARVAELPARRPGLDLRAGLAETRIVPASFVEAPAHRPVHQVVPAMVATAPAYEPAPAPPPPAPVAALPSPPTPPPAVQRVTSSFAPEDTNEDRVLATSDDELEELAGRLYDHIRSRFRAELLIDRERAGLLADRY